MFKVLCLAKYLELGECLESGILRDMGGECLESGILRGMGGMSGKRHSSWHEEMSGKRHSPWNGETPGWHSPGMKLGGVRKARFGMERKWNR